MLKSQLKRIIKSEVLKLNERRRVSKRSINEQGTMPNPAFEIRMYKGFEKFGCSFLMNRGAVIADQLSDSGGKGPKWMSMLRNKIAILRDVAVTSGCGNLPLNV
tara:strand:- start:1625 stop:1936 length:312 start_codon:yes stop_codon:yes gene_type:complete